MKSKLVFLIMIAILFGSCLPAFASADEGGKDEALVLVESTPGNGAGDVALDAQIKLLFNKNVVNITVKDNNSKCFRLLDANNRQVPIEIVFADDQMEPDKKREIILKPKEDLKANMAYKVEILAGLQAKNGTNLDNTVAFTFSTKALPTEKKPEQPPVQTPEEKPEQPLVQAPAEAQFTPSQPQESAAEVKGSSPEEEALPASVPVETAPEITGGESKSEPQTVAVSYRWVIIAAVVAGFLLIISFLIKKRKS